MKKHVANLIRWLVTIAIFYYLFKYKVDARQLWRTVSGAEWIWFVPAVALFGFTFFIGVLRWKLLLETQGIHPPLKRVAAIGFVGQFFNSFLLGATGGDVIKAYYASRQTRTHKAEAVMSVFVDRIIGLIGLFAIAIVMMALNYHWLTEHVNLRWPSLVVLAFIAAVCAIIPLTFWRGLPRRVPWLGKLKEKIPMREQITRALNSYQSYSGHRRVLLQTFLLSVGVHVTIIIGIIFLGQGLHIFGVGAEKYFLIIPLINTIASIPITVSGFGVREGLYELMLGDLGVISEKAVAVGLLSYAVQFVWSLVGGLVYMFWKHEPHMLQHAKEDLAKVAETESQPQA